MTTYVGTKSLGLLDWEAAFPADMAIYNVPGVNTPSCGDSLPPAGAVEFREVALATSTPQAPTALTWAPAPLLVRYGTIPGTAGLKCTPWGGDNVTIVDPITVDLAWPLPVVASSPAPVPAARPPILVAIACLMMAGGVLAANRRRS